MTILRKLIHSIRYKYVDQLVKVFTDIAQSADDTDGILVSNINPFLVTMQILDIVDHLKRTFPLSKMRLDQFDDDLKTILINLLESMYEPKQITKMLKTTNFRGESALDLMAKLKTYTILQTKVTDRVISDYWASKVDVRGTILDNSTCFRLLSQNALSYNEDFESRTRFYAKRCLQDDVSPHLFTYRVWF